MYAILLASVAEEESIRLNRADKRVSLTAFCGAAAQWMVHNRQRIVNAECIFIMNKGSEKR
ncbi:hypothetical protein M105_0352 [Bacteroides fragilis str. 1009-4-F |jgi:hypothetical protein|nr:hypothetical protein AE940_18530 [Bacteroides fragilis]EXZ80372.1 hypothetical protein M144_0311 [Bacteroides fragilis str. 3-F-2 \